MSFRNVATNEYITLFPFRPGGALACGKDPMSWRLYQAPGAAATSFEVKHDDKLDFNHARLKR